jgi:pimeloyl-ACP methyl ester carboxylesterase
VSVPGRRPPAGLRVAAGELRGRRLECDLVLPSLPGYGFSGEPTEVGWDSGRVAQAWAELMGRLGYGRYVAQGGDVGAEVTDARAARHPRGWLAST